MPLMIFCTTWASPLLSRHSASCKYQFAKGFRNVEIRRWGSRRPPGGIKARWGRYFEAKKIHSPGGRRIEAMDEGFHGQGKLRAPGFCGFVQNHTAPQSTLQVMFFSRCDAEIDPKAVRADFEFFIPAEMRRVGLKENFRDVAVPELVAAAAGRGTGEKADDGGFCAESPIKRLRRPEKRHTRPSSAKPCPSGLQTFCAPCIPLIVDSTERRASIRFGCFLRFSQVRRAMKAQESGK